MTLLVAQEEQIRRLHQRGTPIRQIALKTGFSRGTIYRVIRGNRLKYSPRECLDMENDHAVVKLFFCDACGATVTAPCIACQTRQSHRRPPPIPVTTDAHDSNIQLKGAYYERYLQIRKNKEEQQADAVF